MDWAEVAAEIGISARALADIRKGRGGPKDITAAAIDDYLGWPVGSVTELLASARTRPPEGPDTTDSHTGAGRPLSDLRDTGLLWLINRSVFHPRGLALALHCDEHGTLTGWSLQGDGAEPWQFPPDSEHDHFNRARQTLDEATQDAATRTPTRSKAASTIEPTKPDFVEQHADPSLIVDGGP